MLNVMQKSKSNFVILPSRVKLIPFAVPRYCREPWTESCDSQGRWKSEPQLPAGDVTKTTSRDNLDVLKSKMNGKRVDFLLLM